MPCGNSCSTFHTGVCGSFWVNMCEECEVRSWLFFPHYGNWINPVPFVEKTILFLMSCRGPSVVYVGICFWIPYPILWLDFYFHDDLSPTTDSQHNRRWKLTFLIGINSFNRVFVGQHLFVEKPCDGHFTNIMTLGGVRPILEEQNLGVSPRPWGPCDCHHATLP